MKSRVDALRSIRNDSFNLCVIGGGATGAGCALDAQLRGLKTALVDGEDFASGASSASTKMVHGGVRYLEKAVRHLDLEEYKVVKRALRERVHVLRNAPFLTGLRRFITPCYSWREVAYYEVGLKLYDGIAGKAGLAPSRFVSREEALRLLPALNLNGLVGAVAYTDGQFDDARYNVTLVETFVQAGGEALNYARVVAFQNGRDGKIQACEVEDRVSGERFVVHAQLFVNATGAFADTLREMATPGAPGRMRPSRGVHVVLPIELLSGDSASMQNRGAWRAGEQRDALLIPKTEDGRVLFAIPWMGRLLVGTTDEAVTRPEIAGVSPSEVAYLLRHLNRYFAKPVTPAQVVSAFAGVRPLVSSSKSGASDTKGLARDHEVEVDDASGLVSIMGGKWTTYRAMAEDTIDAVEHSLNRPHVACVTSKYPLIGSNGFARDHWRELVSQSDLCEASARHLSEKFGTRAEQVLALTREDGALARPLAPGLAPLRAEIVFSARNEMALSIEDVLGRRIGVEAYGWREAAAAAPAVSDLLAAELRWSTRAKRQALEQYVARIERMEREAGIGA